MLYNIKIAFRNLRHNGLYTIINIVGMAVSLAAVILIMLWVWDELSYDKFYKRSDDIYLLVANVKREKEDWWTQTSINMVQSAKEHAPEIEASCIVDSKYGINYLLYNDKVVTGNSYCMVDTSFFSIFNVSFIEGNPISALSKPGSIVLTQSMAKKIFGNDPALGKCLVEQDEEAGKPINHCVSGVIADFPKNSFFQYDAFIPFERSTYEKYKEWDMWGFQSFLLLKPGSDPTTIAKKITDNYKGRNSKQKLSFHLQLLSDMHLYAPSGKETGMTSVRLFICISILLLAIACINYVNLITARAFKRNKEIGIKKMIGAKMSKLFGEQMLESIMLFIAAILIAFVLIFIFLPFFNQVIGKQLVFDLRNPIVWAITGSVFLLTTLLAGVYPAIKISSLGLISVTGKHESGSRSGFSLRKVLVIFQFMITTGLIVATIVMNQQLHFVLHKQLGYDKAQIFSIDIANNQVMQKHYNSFKNDMEQESTIAGVTATIGNIPNVSQYLFAGGVRWEGMPEGQKMKIVDINVDNTFFETMNIPVIEGTGFSKTPADSNRFYLNETAVKQMGLASPIGKKLALFREGYIAGVVRDFHFKNLNTPIEPIIMSLSGQEYRMIYIKFHPGKVSEALAVTKKIWKKYDSNAPLNYEFMDDTLNQMYMPEHHKSQLFNYFSIIAIFISCLGLFGLVTYMAEMKTKEIGIRKVLGAGINDIVAMLSKEFLLLIVIAMLIAFPITYYWLNKMLQDYAYHISISWWMFGLAALITVILTIATVSFRSIKAARANPVNAIKTE